MNPRSHFFITLISTLLAQSASALEVKVSGIEGSFRSPWTEMRHSSDWVSWRLKQTTGDKVIVARFSKNTGETQSNVSGDFISSRKMKLQKIGITDWKALAIKPISIVFRNGQSVKGTQLDGTYISPSKRIFCFVERQAHAADRTLQLTSTEPMLKACNWNELAKRLDAISVVGTDYKKELNRE